MIVKDLLAICRLLRQFNYMATIVLKNNAVLLCRFRGGKGDQWKSDTVGYIYYDNLHIRQISE